MKLFLYQSDMTPRDQLLLYANVLTSCHACGDLSLVKSWVISSLSHVLSHDGMFLCKSDNGNCLPESPRE